MKKQNNYVIAVAMFCILFSSIISNENLTNQKQGTGKNIDTDLGNISKSAELTNYKMIFETYSWYDAQMNGYELDLNGDDVQTTIALPFSFPFYDLAFTTLNIHSNGLLIFGETPRNTQTNYDFPSTDGNYFIAAFWSNHYAQNNIYIWEGIDFIVIEFNEYGDFNSFSATFEVILFANGDVLIQFKDVYSYSGETVGLNHGLDTTYYTQYVYSIWNEQALYFSQNLPDHDVAVQFENELPALSYVGDTVQIDYRLFNLGANDEPITTYVKVNDEIVQTGTTTFLQGQNSFTFEKSWIPTQSGEYTITISVETTNVDDNLENNEISFIIQILEEMSLGDVNNDGSVDIVDGLMVAQYYVGLLTDTDIDINLADVNNDGFVDIVDALLIAQYYVGLITEFPA